MITNDRSFSSKTSSINSSFTDSLKYDYLYFFGIIDKERRRNTQSPNVSYSGLKRFQVGENIMEQIWSTIKDIAKMTSYFGNISCHKGTLNQFSNNPQLPFFSTLIITIHTLVYWLYGYLSSFPINRTWLQYQQIRLNTI